MKNACDINMPKEWHYNKYTAKELIMFMQVFISDSHELRTYNKPIKHGALLKIESVLQALFVLRSKKRNKFQMFLEFLVVPYKTWFPL